MSHVIWRCPVPGCDYSETGGPGTHFEMVAAYHNAAFHAGHPEFSPGAYDFPPEDEVDGSAYTRDPDWKERLVTNGPVIFWDDPPPDPDRPIDNQTIIDWYRRQRGEETRAYFEDESEVHCGTWLAPAAFALAAAAVVYLSYRWTDR